MQPHGLNKDNWLLNTMSLLLHNQFHGSVGLLLQWRKNSILSYTGGTMSNISPELETLVSNFVDSLVAAVEADVARRLQGVLTSTFGAPAGFAAGPRRAKGKASAVAGPARRKARVSRELVAARKLQGQYLGALRGLSPADHARVKALAHEKGLIAAIKLAHSIKR